MFSSLKVDLKYTTGIDTIYALYDGRFQVVKTNKSYSLFDELNPSDNALIPAIERYIIADPYIYMTTSQHVGGAINTLTSKIITTPIYIKLNYKTGSIEKYSSLEKISESEKRFFLQHLGFFCKMPFIRTCFEKDKN